MPATATPVLLGLSTAACAGLGMFAGQRLTARLGWLRAAWLAQAIALPLVVALALLAHGPPPVTSAVAHALGLGLLNVLSVVTLYRAFAVGPLAIVAPVSAAYSAVTLALAYLTGDPPPIILLPGLLVVLLGVVVVAAARGRATDDHPARERPAGVAWAVLSSMSLGAVFFWLAPVTAELGPAWPVALMRASGVAALALLRLLRPPTAPRAPPPPLLLLACVVLDTAGLLLYAAGAAHGSPALVAVLASLSSVIAVGLAHWRLHERLGPLQWLGVVLVLAGTAWITLHAPRA